MVSAVGRLPTGVRMAVWGIFVSQPFYLFSIVNHQYQTSFLSAGGLKQREYLFLLANTTMSCL
jgi:hypothetical protein